MGHEQGYHPISLILTGHPIFDYAQRALKLHCFGYILKPVSADVLTEELLSAVDAVKFIRENMDIPIPEPTFLSSAKEYIMANLGRTDLNRSLIAKFVHMNPDYISYLFHKESGQALTTFILKERISLAKKMLSASLVTIQEITDQCGFSTTSHYHKQF